MWYIETKIINKSCYMCLKILAQQGFSMIHLRAFCLCFFFFFSFQYLLSCSVPRLLKYGQFPTHATILQVPLRTKPRENLRNENQLILLSPPKQHQRIRRKVHVISLTFYAFLPYCNCMYCLHVYHYNRCVGVY